MVAGPRPLSDAELAAVPDAVFARSALRFGPGWRVGVFARAGDGLQVPPRLDGLATHLPERGVCGGWDAGYSGGFQHVWWADANGWTCVDGRGQPLIWTRGPALHTRGDHLPQVRELRLQVAPGWSRRMLSAEGPHGPLPLLALEDPAPLVDPAYDADLLHADLAWLEQLAASLGAALGAPVTAHIAAR